VIDTKHEKHFETDVSLRVLSQFREEGIKVPATFGHLRSIRADEGSHLGLAH
jgi:hypothetical protein